MNFEDQLQYSLGISEQTAAFLLVFIGLFLLVLFVLWVLLPFAVFGIKQRLDEANQINEKILQQLVNLTNTVRDGDSLSADSAKYPVRSDIKLCPKCHQDNPIGVEVCQHCETEFGQ